SGLLNAHLPDEARATSLSLINALVTLYVGLIGLLLGWLAGRSLPWMFALIGVVVIAGSLLIRIDERKGAEAHADRWCSPVRDRAAHALRATINSWR
ncbi:MAG: hypothetical protein H0W23_00250, partial [Chloroflexia bacterium]|nr:hypothetical protein [Chloroflexia bacterium]